MKLKDMPREELEMLSYTDLTYKLIEENRKSMSTPEIFKEICNLLGYSDEEYASKIGEYYTSLTMDKRFILLDNHEWDIRDHHSVEIVIDEEDEEETEETEEEEDDIVEEEEDDIDEVIDDDIDDDIDDLSIVSDDEEEE